MTRAANKTADVPR